MKNEKRLAPRKAFKTRVVFEDEFNEQFLYFMSTDISISGLFIKTSLPFKNKTKVFLKFSLFEGDESISVAGEIIRLTSIVKSAKIQNPKGLGIRFLGISARNLKKIENFIGNS